MFLNLLLGFKHQHVFLFKRNDVMIKHERNNLRLPLRSVQLLSAAVVLDLSVMNVFCPPLMCSLDIH